MEDNKKMDFRSETYSKWLRKVARFTPVEEADRYTAEALINDLKRQKELADKTLTEREKEDIKNYSYLCNTIDDLKETLRDYEYVISDKANLNDLRIYIDEHKIPMDKALKLFEGMNDEDIEKEA